MSRKHKHRKHKGCCSGTEQHKCGGNCQCNDGVQRVEITTEKELWALINFITQNGKEREKRIEKKDKQLADAMKADVESEVSVEPSAALTPIESAI